MKSKILLVVLCFSVVLCFHCETSKTGITGPDGQIAPPEMSAYSFEFSRYQTDNQLVLTNSANIKRNWILSGIPEWLKASPDHGILADNTTITLTIDTSLVQNDTSATLYFQWDEKSRNISVDFIRIDPVPATIIRAADELVIAKVGQSFFEKNFSLNKHRSRFHLPYDFCVENPESCAEYMAHPFYHISYDFTIAGHPFIEKVISVAVDTSAAIIASYEIYGLPDCVSDPRECLFPVNEPMAVDIARDDGFETGIKPWKISFHWFGGDVQSYVWSVSNTLYEQGAGMNYTAGGNTIIIDANSGEIIERLSWMAIS